MLNELSSSIKEEWGKLNQGAKYLVLCGTLILILLWVEDFLTIGIFERTSFYLNQFSLRDIIFLTAVVLIIIPFPFLLFKYLLILVKANYYKHWKFPYRDMNKNFFIVALNQRVCIIDQQQKQIQWIKSWQTALDLGIVGEWTDIRDIDITLPSSIKNGVFVTKDGTKIELKSYKYGPGIHTRGAPGT